MSSYFLFCYCCCCRCWCNCKHRDCRHSVYTNKKKEEKTPDDKRSSSTHKKSEKMLRELCVCVLRTQFDIFFVCKFATHTYTNITSIYLQSFPFLNVTIFIYRKSESFFSALVLARLLLLLIIHTFFCCIH